MRVARLIALAVVLLFAPAPSRARAETTGDRLVVAINNIPYSQRQVEAYVAVKESLRKADAPVGGAADGTVVRLVDAGNWSDAVAVFTEDMIILQEAHRLGSFATLDQTIEKFQGVVKEKAAKVGTFRTALTRLGVSDQTLVRTLEDVLRVAAFRRGRERPQDAPTGDGRRDGAGAPVWLVELTDRAVVRLYGGADTYITIAPPPLTAPPGATGAAPSGVPASSPGAPESGKAGDAP